MASVLQKCFCSVFPKQSFPYIINVFVYKKAVFQVLKPSSYNNLTIQLRHFALPGRVQTFFTDVQDSCMIGRKLNLSVTPIKKAIFSKSFQGNFHTSPCQKALPPILLLFLRPIARVTAVVLGRSLRVWWKLLPQNKKSQLVGIFKRNKLLYLALLSVVAGGCGHFYINHLEEDPITKRKRFIAFSEEQIKQLANIEQVAILNEYGSFILHSNHPVYQRVFRVTNRILEANKDLQAIQKLKWTVTIVNKPLIKNAFVLPNGSIFIFTGMLSMCSNDDQLGIILAHEISHAILHHMAEILSATHFTELLLIIPIVMVWAILPDIGALLVQWLSGVATNALVHLPFSRNTETEADEVGLQLAAKACFDVREASAFWAKMKIMTSDTSEETVEWLSTHPSYETRQHVLDSLIPSAIQIRQICKCPELSSVDPRAAMEAFLGSVKYMPVISSNVSGR